MICAISDYEKFCCCSGIFSKLCVHLHTCYESVDSIGLNEKEAIEGSLIVTIGLEPCFSVRNDGKTFW